MEQEEGSRLVGLSKSTAVLTCTALATFYVAILYTPTLILRLPPPPSFKNFLIRRFICAAISSLVSLIVSALILPITSHEISYLLGVYGIRADHFWQAVVFPLSLTSLLYSGSFVFKFLQLVDSWNAHETGTGGLSFGCVKDLLQEFVVAIISATSNVKPWRNYVVAPLTEELVFRACMIPLLLCGGFRTYTVIFLCPIFFSLAHLNHLWEYYNQENCSMLKAFTVVGFQLGYTVVFGSYASFLFVWTGHIVAPVAAHIFCNFMGLPVLMSRRSRLVSVAFVAGIVSFVWLLFSFTRPDLYNDRTDDCSCWQGYCT